MNNNYENEEHKMSRTGRRNYGRTHHAWVLAGAGFLSVGGNALHAATTSLPVWARVAIVMLYPLALLVATHSAVVVMREFTGWVRWATGSLALMTGAFSFVLSFVALREVSVMAGLPDNALAVIGALVLDLTIVQATIVVVMASRRIAADEAIDGPAVETEPRRPGALSRIGGNLVARVERATAPQSADEAGRHRVEARSAGQPVAPVTVSGGQSDDISADSVARVSVTRPAGHVDDVPALSGRLVAEGRHDTAAPVSAERPAPLSWSADLGVDSHDTAVQAVTDSPEDTVTNDHDTAVTGLAGTVTDTVADSDDTAVLSVTDRIEDTVMGGHDTAVTGLDDTVTDTIADSDDTVVTGLDDNADDTVTDTADDACDEAPDLSGVAAIVIDAVGTSADPAVVEQALRLSLGGLSARKVSEALGPDGPSRTPVAAWVKAAKEVPDYAVLAGLPHRPNLSVVGE